MIHVHDIFVCKPGNASKLAKASKEVMSGTKEFVCIMTDMTGQYHRVIMVSQYENLAAYEEQSNKYMNPTPEMKEQMDKMEAMGNMQEMYTTGSREIYKIW